MPDKKLTDFIKLLADGLNAVDDEVKRLKTSMVNMESKIQVHETVTEELKNFKKKVEMEESRARRNNIVIHGLEVTNGSVNESVNELMDKKLKVKVQLKSTKCLGNPAKGAVPILVSFPDMEQKLIVFRNCHLLRGERISITDDLTDDERKQRKKPLPVLKAMKAEGKKVRFRGTDLC